MRKLLLFVFCLINTSNCFADVPNMRKYPHNLHYTEGGEKSYVSRPVNQFEMKKERDKNGYYFRGYDKLTNSNIYVYGVFGKDEEPKCEIHNPVNNNGNFIKSDCFNQILFEDGDIYLFCFVCDGYITRFGLTKTSDYDGIGRFQTFLDSDLKALDE